MDDLSSSVIHEDVIIFSTRKINAWNTTIHRGSIIILGGDREILRDILNYKKAVAAKNTDQAESSGKVNSLDEPHGPVVTSSSTPPEEDFHLIQANNMKVPQNAGLFRITPKKNTNLQDILIVSQGSSEAPGTTAGDLQAQNNNSGPIAVVFRTY